MRYTDFWERMERHLGPTYARSYAHDQVLAQLRRDGESRPWLGHSLEAMRKGGAKAVQITLAGSVVRAQAAAVIFGGKCLPRLQ